MKIDFAVESFTEGVEELDKIVHEHYEEVAWYQDKMPCNPNYESYKALDAQEMLVYVTARSEGKLLGYGIWFVLNHMHSMNSVVAVNDSIYLSPEVRGGEVAYSMLSSAFEYMKEKGAGLVTLNMKTTKPFTRLCESLGMEPQEVLYTKYLGD